jgi:hypothetical protein
MAIKETISEVLNRPVSRREFLKQVGMLVLAVVGVTALLHSIKKPDQTESGGYGLPPYGG